MEDLQQTSSVAVPLNLKAFITELKEHLTPADEADPAAA